jgi:hypothetical protein
MFTAILTVVGNALNLLLILTCLSLLLILIEIHILEVLRDHILCHSLMLIKPLVLLHHVDVSLLLIVVLLH